MRKSFKGLTAVALGMGIWIMLYLPGIVVAEPITGGIANVAITDANTEYSYALIDGVAAVSVQCRGTCAVKLAFTSGASGSTYVTIKSGTAYYETNISSFGNTLYFQSPSASQVLEIVYWVD